MTGEVVQQCRAQADQQYYHMNAIASPESCRTYSAKMENIQKSIRRLNALANKANVAYARFGKDIQANAGLLTLRITKEVCKGFLDMAASLFDTHGDKRAAAVAKAGASGIDLADAVAMRVAGVDSNKQFGRKVGGVALNYAPSSGPRQVLAGTAAKDWLAGKEQASLHKNRQAQKAVQVAVNRDLDAIAGTAEAALKASSNPQAAMQGKMGKALVAFKVAITARKFRQALEDALDDHHNNYLDARARIITVQRQLNEEITKLTKALNEVSQMMNECVTESRPT